MTFEDFTKEALQELQEFQRWLESQDKSGEDHSYEDWLDLWSDMIHADTRNF